jgi:RHS repeat-associated protein
VTTTTNYVDVATVGLTIDRQGAGTGGVTASGLSCAGGASTQAVPCGTTYAFNTVVTLTAVPDSGSTFQGWGGVCSGTGTCQVTLTSARFVTARFGKVPSSYATKYYHADVIGSIRAITKENGTLDGDRHDYRPFGEDVAPLTGDPNRFAGKQLDAETALHYFDARYYRQTWGRFTSVDPLHVGAAMTDPQRWNRYAYAGNNPLKYGDPSGLSHGPVFGAQTDACAWGGTYPHCLPRPFGPDPGGQNGYIGGGIPGIGGRPGNNSGATTLIDHGNGTCSWAHPDDPSEAYFGPFACGDDTNTYTPQGPVQTVPTAGTPEGPGTTPGGPTNVPPPTAAPTTTSEVIRVGACMGDAGLGFLVGRAVPAYGVAQAMGMKLTPLTFAAGGSLFDLGVFGEGSYSGRDAAGVGTSWWPGAIGQSSRYGCAR